MLKLPDFGLGAAVDRSTTSRKGKSSRSFLNRSTWHESKSRRVLEAGGNGRLYQMDEERLLERITVNPQIFGGKPIIRDEDWRSNTCSGC